METTLHWLSLAFDRVVSFLPNLIAGLVILLVGYIVALVLAKATRAIAHRLGFDRFISRLGFGELKGEQTASRGLGSVVFFFVIVATLMQTARAWLLTSIADGLARFLAYSPHLLAAAVVFVVALFLGNWVRDWMLRSSAVEGEDRRVRAKVLPSAVRAGIIAFGSFMALRELQIAPEIVNAAFILIFAAGAVATALAFGLGARGTAGRIAENWYEKRNRGVVGPQTSIEMPPPVTTGGPGSVGPV